MSCSPLSGGWDIHGAIISVRPNRGNDPASAVFARNADPHDTLMDALSAVLHAVQLNGAVFLDAKFSAPWALISQQEQGLCAAYLPPADRVVSFHLVTHGRCRAMLPGDPETAVQVDAGDMLVVPRGEAHIMASALDLPPLPAAPLLADKVEAATGDVMRLDHGGGGEATQILCGFLAVQDVSRNPLLAALPRLFTVGMRESNAAWIESSMRFAASEAGGSRPGGATVLAKLSELLFVEAIRRYIDLLPGDQKGWLGGLRDHHVARVLALMHERPAHPWTVDDLAQRAGVSRSVLAQRFGDLLGVPPMQYLAHWRLQLAAQRLRAGNQPLAAIAEQVGYDSEAAFSRAFKREFGQPPATWRRHDSLRRGAR